MKKKSVALLGSVLVVSTLFVGAKAYDHVALGKYDHENGKALYQEHCMGCHGTKGHGDGELAADLSVSPDNISEELNNPFGFKQELIQSIYLGDNGQQGEMPAFKDVLSQSDINDALEYIRSVNDFAVGS